MNSKTSFLVVILGIQAHIFLMSECRSMGNTHPLQKRVSQAIQECLEEEKVKQSLDVAIEQEIEQELLRDIQIPSKKMAQGVYALPQWPFHALFYRADDLFQITVTFDAASQSYSATGRTQNLSQLVFGKCPILIRDILLVSALAEDGKVGSGGLPDAADFATLAQQPVIFNASTYKIGASFNYARHFCENRLSVGLEIPVVFRKNQLRLTNRLKNDVQEKLTPTENGGKFKNKTLKQLLIDILDAHGITYKQNNSRTGLGDIILFADYDFPTTVLEHFIIGVKIVAPTSRGRSFERLWDPELGNNGFALFGCYGSGFLKVHQFFNPHVHMSLQLGFGNSFNMRVPKCITFDGSDTGRFSTLLPDNSIPFSSNLFLLKDTPFQRLDTCVREFAGNCRRVKVTRGPEFFLRAGNVIEKFFFKGGFLDIYYDLLVKGKNYLGKRCEQDFDARIWTKNSDVIEHRLGVDFSYQCDEKVRLTVGGSYVFAGKNSDKNIHVQGILNVEF